jgi:methylmalonyl-CoA mutase
MATGRRKDVPVIGITGTGGAGKSSVTDELLNRFLASFPDMRIAVISVDPTRRRTGGALLGDRIRMNSACAASASTCARWPRAASTWPPTWC